MRASVVIAIYNERDNIRPLHGQLEKVLAEYQDDYEIIFVDDGSTDGSLERLRALADWDDHVKVVCLRRNFGQTAALKAGFEVARGDIIITLDGDLQNDPADIPEMIRKLDEGYDLVHGWRKDRRDPWLTRVLPSRIANWLIAATTGLPIHDLGCSLKVIRRDIAQELELYGEMHRFIAVLAWHRGARCAELVTRHHPRRFGASKYGLSRVWRVLLDLVTVKYMLTYFASPMKLFGKIGMLCGLASGLSLLLTLGMKLLHQVDMSGNPMLLLSVMSLMVGVQFLSLGLLGEVNARIYFDRTPDRSFAVRETIGWGDEHHPQSLPSSRAA